MSRYVIVLLLGVSCFSSCKDNPSEFRNVNAGGALGTSYSIISITSEKVQLQEQIDSVFTVINQSLSTYLPESDISKINRGDSTLTVDHMFREVFALSKEIYEDTEGYFDPTVGTLVNAWGFGPEVQMELDCAKVDSLLRYVGFGKVALTADHTIKKADPKVYMDFNAIAKGYAIDRLAAMLDERNVEHYLIEVGGELVAKGINSIKGKPWVVGIDDPQMDTERTTKLLINLKDKALASSGNYRKFRVDERTGKKYVHTINPKTGFTQNSNTLAVTILANDCATADGYATAFMAMELSEAFKLINKNVDLDAYIVYLDEHGETQEFLTKGFKALVVE